eukprot:SAG11_NODE_28186_length_324_cov_1.151111_1_plen_72_part_01
MAAPPLTPSPAALLLPLDTQQQPGPGRAQQLVQNVIHVQSTSFAPGDTRVAQPEYLLAETVPGKSIPHWNCG